MQEESSLTDSVNEMMGEYQMDGAGYHFMSSYKDEYQGRVSQA